MRQIDSMTPEEIDILKLKGMLSGSPFILEDREEWECRECEGTDPACPICSAHDREAGF